MSEPPPVSRKAWVTITLIFAAAVVLIAVGAISAAPCGQSCFLR
jgi:hypothetical protein